MSQEFEAAVKSGKIKLEAVNETDPQMFNLKKLHAGRIDAVINDSLLAPYQAKVLGLSGEIVSLGPAQERLPGYLILSKNSALPNKEDWQQKMTRVLQDIWDDGTQQTITARYIGTSE